MRFTSRAIIINQNGLLTLFRRRIYGKSKKEYFTIPGGGMELNETTHQTVKRELMEEMGLQIEILGYLGLEKRLTTTSHYYHCKIISGTPVLGGEELERNKPEDYHEPRYIDPKKIHSVSIPARSFIEKAIKQEYVEDVCKTS